ncbi:MAG TPA: DUF4907 domain-containing protein [Hanamia sp.]
MTTGENGALLSSTWEYDFATDLWTSKTAFEGAARTGALGFSANGGEFVTTGRSSTYPFDDLRQFFQPRLTTPMTKKIYILIGVFFIVFIIGLSVNTNKKVDDKMLKVESTPIQTASGWGYNILVDHKIFIHQEYIPAIAGNKAFLNKEDAMKTAGLAISKLIKGKQPSITKEDLTALKISLP